MPPLVLLPLVPFELFGSSQLCSVFDIEGSNSHGVRMRDRLGQGALRRNRATAAAPHPLNRNWCATCRIRECHTR